MENLHIRGLLGSYKALPCLDHISCRRCGQKISIRSEDWKDGVCDDCYNRHSD